jgi:rifampicin phosphotransferase
MRNFRLGEWLPEAMTPLFTDWLLERLEHGYLQATRHHTGAALMFPHATINGWYYTAHPPPVTVRHAGGPGQRPRAACPTRACE